MIPGSGNRQSGELKRPGTPLSADWLIVFAVDGPLCDLPCPESPRFSNMAVCQWSRGTTGRLRAFAFQRQQPVHMAF